MAIVIAATAKRWTEPSAIPSRTAERASSSDLHDEELQRGEHLARAYHPDRGQQEKSAGECIEGKDVG